MNRQYKNSDRLRRLLIAQERYREMIGLQDQLYELAKKADPKLAVGLAHNMGGAGSQVIGNIDLLIDDALDEYPEFKMCRSLRSNGDAAKKRGTFGYCKCMDKCERQT